MIGQQQTPPVTLKGPPKNATNLRLRQGSANNLRKDSSQMVGSTHPHQSHVAANSAGKGQGSSSGFVQGNQIRGTSKNANVNNAYEEMRHNNGHSIPQAQLFNIQAKIAQQSNSNGNKLQQQQHLGVESSQQPRKTQGSILMTSTAASLATQNSVGIVTGPDQFQMGHYHQQMQQQTNMAHNAHLNLNGGSSSFNVNQQNVRKAQNSKKGQNNHNNSLQTVVHHNHTYPLPQQQLHTTDLSSNQNQNQTQTTQPKMNQSAHISNGQQHHQQHMSIINEKLLYKAASIAQSQQQQKVAANFSDQQSSHLNNHNQHSSTANQSNVLMGGGVLSGSLVAAHSQAIRTGTSLPSNSNKSNGNLGGNGGFGGSGRKQENHSVGKFRGQLNSTKTQQAAVLVGGQRERGLSASAIDQNRIVNQMKVKQMQQQNNNNGVVNNQQPQSQQPDVRNYSVGVHKNVHNVGGTVVNPNPNQNSNHLTNTSSHRLHSNQMINGGQGVVNVQQPQHTSIQQNGVATSSSGSQVHQSTNQAVNLNSNNPGHMKQLPVASPKNMGRIMQHQQVMKSHQQQIVHQAQQRASAMNHVGGVPPIQSANGVTVNGSHKYGLNYSKQDQGGGVGLPHFPDIRQQQIQSKKVPSASMITSSSGVGGKIPSSHSQMTNGTPLYVNPVNIQHQNLQTKSNSSAHQTSTFGLHLASQPSTQSTTVNNNASHQLHSQQQQMPPPQFVRRANQGSAEGLRNGGDSPSKIGHHNNQHNHNHMGQGINGNGSLKNKGVRRTHEINSFEKRNRLTTGFTSENGDTFSSNAAKSNERSKKRNKFKNQSTDQTPQNSNNNNEYGASTTTDGGNTFSNYHQEERQQNNPEFHNQKPSSSSNGMQNHQRMIKIRTEQEKQHRERGVADNESQNNDSEDLNGAAATQQNQQQNYGFEDDSSPDPMRQEDFDDEDADFFGHGDDGTGDDQDFDDDQDSQSDEQDDDQDDLDADEENDQNQQDQEEEGEDMEAQNVNQDASFKGARGGHDNSLAKHERKQRGSSSGVSGNQRVLRHAQTIGSASSSATSHQLNGIQSQATRFQQTNSQKISGSTSKKAKLKAIQEMAQSDSTGNNQNNSLKEEQYSPHNVVAKMLMRKDRKIPGSVFKPHSEEVILLQSVALGQPQPSARVYFPYPAYCFKDDNKSVEQRDTNGVLIVNGDSSTMIQGASFLRLINWSIKPQLRSFQKVQTAKQDYFRQHQMTLGFKIADSTHIYNSVVNSLKTGGFRIVSPGSSKWNVMWTGQTKPDHLKEATKYQKINHFPQSFQVGRKDMMWKNYVRMRRHYPEFNHCPKTYLFPDDFRKFCNDRETENFKHMYIMKPSASSCGRGIKIVGCKQEVKRKPGYVVSQYVSNPHLIDGFKYDLRIYALVSCFDPLKIYLFKEGLVRFATQKYTNSQKATDKRYIHLTNYSINKKSDDYIKNSGGADQQNGQGVDASKWNLAQLKQHFEKIGVNYNTVMHRIKDVIIKTLISVEPHIVATYSRCTKHRNVCFELYGFDILLDSKLKPWLLEVNISPSLSSSSALDKKIKTVLICDTLNLVGVYPYDRKQYEKETEQTLKKRLLGLDRNTTKEESSIVSEIVPESYLGKLNRQLAKSDAEGLTEDDLAMLLDFEEEQFRLGNFEKIFPCINNVTYYGQFFEYTRAANNLLMRYLSMISPKHNAHHVCYIPPQSTNGRSNNAHGHTVGHRL